MKQLIKLKTIARLLLPLMLTCFALLPRAQAFTTDPDETFTNFNTAAGLEASLANTGTGASNTAYGARALRANTTGSSNLGLGGFALINNLDGFSNTAVGNNAMFSNQSGDNNMALGQGALGSNVSGNSNVAMGSQALAGNTASNNTGVGFQSLASNTASDNTAVGFQALFSNTTAGGTNNASVAVGYQALFNANAGDESTAFGTQALFNLRTGAQNHAVGWHALFGITSGNGNTAIGEFAGGGLTGSDSNNVMIGRNIGGHAGENGFIRIANNNPPEAPIVMANFSKVLIGGIHDTVITNLTSRTVQVNAAGQLAGIVVSSARYKKDIEPMDKASESILALRPVTFHYKEDKTNKLCFGLIAEEVAKVDPALVELDKEGKPLGVRYDDIPIRLLNEFLKEHKKVEEQQASITAQQATIAEQQASIAELKSTVAQQQKGMEVLTAQLDQQAAQIQKVRADLEASKPAPQVVNNP